MDFETAKEFLPTIKAWVEGKHKNECYLIKRLACVPFEYTEGEGLE